MFIEERREEILKELADRGKVLVRELSSKYGVTEGMIRKDLQYLEGLGLLKRTYGGAIPLKDMAEEVSLNKRLVSNLSKKTEIAKKAFGRIRDGEIIFVDTSSINHILCEMIANSTLSITLVTNMVDVVSMFSNNTTVNIVCIGGRYSKSLGGVIGSEAENAIRRFHYSKCFIGSAGINAEKGYITNFDLEEGNTKKAVIEASTESYILMESSKFYKEGHFRFAVLSEVTGIITDDDVDDRFRKMKKLVQSLR